MEFSDAEFSDILSAFAEVDDMLIGWDAVMTPPRDAEGASLPVDQRPNDLHGPALTTGTSPFLFGFSNLAEDMLSTTAASMLGVGLVFEGLPDAQAASSLGPMGDSNATAAFGAPQAFGGDSQALQISSSTTPHQASSLLAQAAPPRQHSPQAQQPAPLEPQPLPPQQPRQPVLLPQWQHAQQQQQQGPTQFSQQPTEPPLPYIVQTPSSSFAADPSSGTATGSQARGSMDASSTGGGATVADPGNFSGFSGGGVSEYDGDGGGCWSSSMSVSAAVPSPPPPAQQPSIGGGRDTCGVLAAATPAAAAPSLPHQLLQWPLGALVTSDSSGTVVWAPVAHLPPPATAAAAAAVAAAATAASASASQPAGANPCLPGQGAQTLTAPPPAATTLLPVTSPSGTAPAQGPAPGLQLGLGPAGVGLGLGRGAGLELGPGPGSVPAVATAQAHGSTQAWGPGRGTTSQRLGPTVGCCWGTSAAAAPQQQLAVQGHSLLTVPAAAAAGAGGGGGSGQIASRPAAGQTTALAPAAAAVGMTTSGGVSGSALLAELVAEAAAGGWAAVATGLAPLPPGEGRTAEELLAGLDLTEVFAPSKPSHAKRIRGHVRRAAELKAQLADRVRAIQRLAAENADLRGRAKVLELVVRCRDEQLRLLRNYRTSADGRMYYVEQLMGLGGDGGGGDAAVGAGGGGGAGALVPYIGTNAVALATMPAAGLLEMFRKLVADVSQSLAEVEGGGDDGGGGGVSSPSTVTARAAKPTHGSRIREAAAPLAPAGGDDVDDGGGCGAALQLVTTGSFGADGGAAAAAGGPSGGLARLRGQMALFRNVLRYLGLVNEEACKFADTTLTGESAAPEPGHWLRVVSALRLGPQQLADAAALHACWQDWLARIHAERRSVTAALDQLLSVNRYGATYFESVGQYGTDRDVIHKIHANVMRERILLVLTGEVFCCHILTDLQWARAIVHSYPYILDVRELVRAASQLYYATTRGLMAASLSS